MADKEKKTLDNAGAGAQPIPLPNDDNGGFSPKLEELVDGLLGDANEPTEADKELGRKAEPLPEEEEDQ
ncbi:hypothetical protein B9T62_21945 [Paenibacillus donghaensis]|uniref:Uncharacterized protein n=1 Tax=Paenibacillus donghaensis TaxID=414771 RepID=A0A2Z2KBS9_9BACL|nr:hypothetical protein B9T62_21945 [Paenibacillus donghaensis]